MVERGLKVTWIQPDEHLAHMYALVVRGQDLGDEAADMRRDGGHVAADIGIVRGLDVASHGPPAVASPGDAGERGQGGADESEAPQPGPRQAASGKGGRVADHEGFSHRVVQSLAKEA